MRDVAAHLTSAFTTSGPTFLVNIVQCGFNFDRANDKITRKIAEQPVEAIVETLRANAEHRFTPPTMGAEAPLTDAIVHGQDIRRPLGLIRDFPEAHLVRSLDFVTGKQRGFVPKGRLDGLRFEATDVGWSSGAGAELRGSGEAVLLAITGRGQVLDELEGDGAEILRGRLR